MNSENPTEEAIYDAARLLRQTVARVAFLEASCAGDAALRERIEHRLAAEGVAPEPLESPAQTSSDFAETISARAVGEVPGERIGRYKLLQQIGEGGFGTVWMAEQVTPVSRRVALKIIKLGMDTREVIARFEAERQALAMMDHPNIAKVLDAGATERGRLFFVMELVKGSPITQFCDENKLGTRERLGLFSDICSALNHAHQKGIIHRDIKPSNVMVTLHGDKAVVKVIDFGIAKAVQGKLTDKTLFTRYEQLIGTPAYMSPEQVTTSGLDIDTRSDIYSLGILLYELLTGKTPFDGKSLASVGPEEMRRVIREVEPQKPSSRLSTTVGDERNALARSRHIEPEKLRQLVEPDLDWIVMKAIEKDRTRRYETADGFALDIKRFLQQETVSARPPSARYRLTKFAHRNKSALLAAAAIVSLLVIATVVSVLLALRAMKAEKETSRQRDEKDTALKESQETARIFKEILGQSLPGRDSKDITLVDALGGAAAQLESGTDPGVKAQLETTLAETLHALGIYDQPIPLQQRAVDFYEKKLGPEDPTTLRAKGLLGWYLYDNNDKKTGEKLQEEVLATTLRVLGPKAPDTITAHARLAVSLYFNGQKKQGLKALEESFALSQEVFGPDARESLPLRHWLANAYRDAGDVAKADAMNEALLPLMQKHYGAHHPETLRAMSAVAISRMRPGHEAEALKLHQDVLQLSKEVFTPQHPYTLAAMATLAHAYSKAGQPAQALALREETLKIMQAKGTEDSPDGLWVMEELGTSYEEAGEKAKAQATRQRVVDLISQKQGPQSDKALQSKARLAESLAGESLNEAIDLMSTVVPRLRALRGDGDSVSAWVMGDLAGFYAKAGRQAEALALRRELLEAKIKSRGIDDVSTIGPRTYLGVALGDNGQFPEGIEVLEKALALTREHQVNSVSQTRWIMGTLAAFYEKVGRLEDAAKLKTERETIKQDAPPAKSTPRPPVST